MAEAFNHRMRRRRGEVFQQVDQRIGHSRKEGRIPFLTINLVLRLKVQELLICSVILQSQLFPLLVVLHIVGASDTRKERTSISSLPELLLCV